MRGHVDGEEAIVLRAVAYGEADRVVVLFGATHGKISALAKGARRSQKRFAGGLGLFSLGRATYAERQGAELARLDRFEPKTSWPGVLADLGKIAHASYAAELVDALTPLRQPDPPIFSLAVDFIRQLDASVASAALLRVFELQLLDRLGLRPALERCVACGRVADDRPGQRLDPQRGGVVCGRCAATGPLLDGEGRAALLRAQETKLVEASSLSLSAEAHRGAREALQAVLAHHAGRALRSVEFIEKLRQAGP